MKIGIATFNLPGQEKKAMDLINNPDIEVTISERYLLPKEGYLILYIQYEDNREEGVFD